MYILTGILLGLGTLAFIGPVLFYLLKASVSGGVKIGIAVAFGVLLGDIICVVIAILGGNNFFENTDFQWFMSLFGGFILLGLGLKNVISPNKKSKVKVAKKGKTWWVYFMNGFLINFVNPFVFAVWFGFAAYNRSKFSELETTISLSVTLAVIFITDLLKAYFAEKLTLFVRDAWLLRIYRFIGVLMILFSARLFYFVLA